MHLQITALVLDDQCLSKLSGLEDLNSLKWASFNNNDIAKIEVSSTKTSPHVLSWLNQTYFLARIVFFVAGIGSMQVLGRTGFGEQYDQQGGGCPAPEAPPEAQSGAQLHQQSGWQWPGVPSQSHVPDT